MRQLPCENIILNISFATLNNVFRGQDRWKFYGPEPGFRQNSNSSCSKSTFTNELNNIDNGTSAGGSREGSVESVLAPPDSVTGSKSPPKIGLRNSGSVTGEVFIECEVGSGRATECISTDRLFSSFRRVADDRKLQSDRTCRSLLQGRRTDQAMPSHGLYLGMILYRKYSPIAILRSRDYPTSR